MSDKHFNPVLRVICDPNNAVIDIVAVHGLNPKGKDSHGMLTWTVVPKGGNVEEGVMWLRDFLPDKIPNARIFLFEYNSKAFFDKGKIDMRGNSRKLLEGLLPERKEEHTKDRPLLFICHSLGGIVVKKALVEAMLDSDPYLSIKNSTHGITFFATPHHGGEFAALGGFISKLLGENKTDLLEVLKKDSPIARYFRQDFGPQLRDYHFLSFYETKPYGKLGIIVKEASARINAPRETVVAVDADHSEICRFESRNEEYEKVEENVLTLVRKALIAAQERERKYQKKEEASKIPLTSSLLELSEKVDKLTKMQQSALQMVEDKERSEILQWLSTVEYQKHHKRQIRKTTDGTCQWLLKSRKFRNWRESTESSILWLQGDHLDFGLTKGLYYSEYLAGTGKTQLTANVIQHCLAERKRRQSDESIAYFYCDRGEPNRSKDLDTLFNTILKQLSSPSSNGPLQSFIVKAYQKLENEGFPSKTFLFDKSLSYIQRITDLYPKTTIIIDGIDEIEEKDAIRKEVLNAVKSLVQKSKGLVKIFCSSRPERDIELEFKGVPSHYISSTDNKNDIALFVRSEISKRSKGGIIFDEDLSPGLEERICRKIIDLSNGMFQWAYTQIDIFGNVYEMEEEIENVLGGDLPALKRLNGLYDIIYKKFVDSAEEKWKAIGINLIQLVMAAERPLTPAEASALASVGVLETSPKINQILHKCRNMVVWDEEQNVLRFSHLSVREYLESEHGYSPSHANDQTLKLCLKLLIRQSKRETHSSSSKSRDAISYAYAMDCWQIHCVRAIDGNSLDADGKSLLEEFFGNYENVGKGFTFYYKTVRKAMDNKSSENYAIDPFDGLSLKTKSSPQENATLAAVLVGYENFLHGFYSSEQFDLSKNWASWFGVPKSKWHYLNEFAAAETLLTLAIRNKRKSIILKFLANGNLEAQMGGYESILHAAVRWGNAFLVRYLLESSGVGPTDDKSMIFSRNDALGQHRYPGGITNNVLGALGTIAYSPVSVTGGLIGANEGENLLRDHLYPGGMTSRISTALIMAASLGHYDMVELLIRFGGDVNHIIYELRECFHRLSRFGPLYDPYGPNGALRNVSALSAAALRGRLEVMKLLLDSGSKVNVEPVNLSPLSAAAFAGSLEGIKILLDHGADIIYEDEQFGCPLSAAIEGENPHTAKFLLDNGANVNATYNTPEDGQCCPLKLIFMVSYRSKDILPLLVAYGADIESQGGLQGLFQLLEGLETNWLIEPMVRIGLDVNTSTPFGGSLLAILAVEPTEHEADYCEQMESLIELGADVNFLGGIYGCALSAAASLCHSGRVKLLLKHGADVNLRGGVHSSPLGAIEDFIYGDGARNGKDTIRLRKCERSSSKLKEAEEVRKMLIDAGAVVHPDDVFVEAKGVLRV